MNEPKTILDLLEEMRAIALTQYIISLDNEYKIDFIELIDYIKKKYPLRKKEK